MEAGLKREWHCFPATQEAYKEIRSYVMAEAEAAGLSPKRQLQLELGMEEAVVNVIMHAYKMPGKTWLLAGSTDPGRFTIDMVDHGTPFNPLAERPVVDEDIPLMEREPGGLGITLMKKTFSVLDYNREEFQGKIGNHLQMELDI